MVSMDYSGKNYIVTGGAGGIGGAVVDGIVSGGGHAVIVDINEAGARKYQEKYGEDKVTVAAVDLSNPAEIREKFGALVQKFGQIHGLICVAGIVSTSKFEDVTQAEWDRVVAINLTGVFASIQSVFTNMKEHSYGRIVVVSSVAAQVGGGVSTLALLSAITNTASAAGMSPISTGGSMGLAAYTQIANPTEEERSKLFIQLFAVSIGGVIVIALFGMTGVYGLFM